MPKQLLFDEKAREAIKTGIDKMANAVKVTLGPKGRNVVMDKGYGSPTVTKDGVTVAKEIEFEDKFQNIGASLVKEIAEKTDDVAGDGTTTAVVLAQQIIAGGFAAINSGANPVMLKQGIDAALEAVLKYLEGIKLPVEGRRLVDVATIAANDAEVGSKIAEVFEKVGREGVVTVEESQTTGVTHEVVEGLRFDRGYISPYMVTNAERMEAVWEEPHILITEKKISSIHDILPALEKVAQAGKKNLVIIAEDVEGEALATIVVNKLRGTFSALAVKAPGFGDRRKEMLEDIAVVTGGRVISEEIGVKMDKIDLEMLGEARRVAATKDDTTIIGGKGSAEAIQSRIKQIKAQIKETDSEFDREKLQERLAKLSGGVAVIKVGAATETEMKEKKYRVEDAVKATQAALEEGIVPGGGVALLIAAHAIRPEAIMEKQGRTPRLEAAAVSESGLGADILVRTLVSPLQSIAQNAGKSGNEVVQDVYRRNFELAKSENKYPTQLPAEKMVGYDAARNRYGPMLEYGIVDPLKVVKTALQNAASIASLLLTTEAAVADIPKKEEKMPPMPPGEY